jgi:glycosyltransferase involved in cell wall biosynthesis
LPLVGRVIVVDNDSTDRTAAVARECRAIVAFEKRRGYQALTFFLDVGPLG